MDMFTLCILLTVGFCSMVGTLVGLVLAILIRKIWRL